MCLPDRVPDRFIILGKVQMRFTGAICAAESADRFADSADPAGYRAFDVVVGHRHHHRSNGRDRQQIVDVPLSGFVPATRDIYVAFDSFEPARPAGRSGVGVITAQQVQNPELPDLLNSIFVQIQYQCVDPFAIIRIQSWLDRN